MIGRMITGLVLTGASCAPISDLVPAERITSEVISCERTVFTDWESIPTCDMNGSQTWILTDDVKWYDYVYLDYLEECQNLGGIFSYHDWDDAEVTVTCINVDY